MAKVYGFVGKFGSNGSGNGQFNFSVQTGNAARTSGIAVNANYIYVLDTGNARVQIFNIASPYDYVGQFGSAGSGNGQFTTPRAIEIDATHIYVRDYTRVQKFDIGTYAYVSGVTVQTANDIYGMGIDDTYLYVVGASNLKVIYKASYTIQYDGAFSPQKPADIAVGVGYTYIYVCSAYQGFLFDSVRIPTSSYNSGGTPLASSANVSYGITLDTNYIYVSNYTANTIRVYDLSTLAYVEYFGSYGQANGYFDGVGGLRVYNNKLYSIDTGNSRVQIFDWSDKIAPAAPSGLTLACVADNKILVSWTDNS